MLPGPRAEMAPDMLRVAASAMRRARQRRFGPRVAAVGRCPRSVVHVFPERGDRGDAAEKPLRIGWVHPDVGFRMGRVDVVADENVGTNVDAGGGLRSRA